MKKNKLMIASATLGTLLLATSVFAFATTGSSYQEYKGAVKAMAFMNNLTATAEVELKDNGSIILSGNSTNMINQDEMKTYSNNSFVLDGKTHSTEMSMIDGKIISNQDGEYTSFTMVGDMRNPHFDSRELDESSSTLKLMEMVVDTFVGDVKNQFVKDGDTITVNLEGAQIPELARLGISAMMENTDRINENHSNDETSAAFFNRIPQLTTIDVKSLSMTADVKGGYLVNNQFKAVIAGIDAKGVSHELEMIMNLDVTDINSTVVKSVDTTGKIVREAQPREFHMDMQDGRKIMEVKKEAMGL